MICLELPEADEQVSGQHASYSVRGQKFAYLLEDHHGDGRLGLCFKVPEGKRAALLAREPACYIPAYIGYRGWRALDLDAAEVDWQELVGLVVESYTLAAPKRLVALIAETPD